VVRAVAADFVVNYQQLDDGQEWFQQIRDVAAKHGFARNATEFKKDPDAFPGSIREASQIIRIAITGSTRSPDLHSITQALGQEETLRRFAALTA
jgi:glutamyl-tRNA synthetase